MMSERSRRHWSCLLWMNPHARKAFITVAFQSMGASRNPYKLLTRRRQVDGPRVDEKPRGKWIQTDSGKSD